MAAPTEPDDDYPLAGLRNVVATLVGQIERLETEVAAQAKVIEEQSRTIEDLKLAVTVWAAVAPVHRRRPLPGSGDK